MDTKDTRDDTQHDIKSTENGDESCILIDGNITTIVLDDTIESEPSNELASPEIIAESPTQLVTSIGEFEVIDEVIDEDPGSQEETQSSCNGTLNESVEVCAPNNLDVTPITQPPSEFENSKLLIDIKFTNRKTYLAFQEEFVALVKNYYKSKLDDLNICDDMSSNRIRVSEKLVKKSDAFLVDTTPNLKNLKEAGDESTPQYRKSFGKAMLTDEKTSEVKPNASSRSRGACFNCDQTSHSLHDCPEPRNMRKINQARNEFSKSNSNVRYHEDNENNPAAIPGKISDELRVALGINAGQIPPHVYKMRQFGYPPGWFEEAKVHHSGLSLFVEKDKKQLHPDAEDDSPIDSDDFKFDVQKIFDFPGFNVAPDHDFHDMHYLYNAPPMILQHSKQEMIRALGDAVVNGYKKKKMRESSGCINDTATDMDIEDSTSVDSADETAPMPSKSSEPMEDGELSGESRSESPNESELIEKRKALMAEIAESSVFLDTSSVNSSLNTTMTNRTPLNQNQMNSTIIENSENENRDNSAKETVPEVSRTGHVDSTIVGCPVLPSFSPFNSLPAGEKFQEGVCDVIAFENLSESTGKYEKMKTLINKVRDFQKDHQT